MTKQNEEVKGIDMRLYDLNKTIMGTLEPFDMKESIKILSDYFFELYKEDKISTNYMLLSAEDRDFTVFRFRGLELRIDEMVNEILEVVESRGVVKDVTKNDDATVDIWVDDRLYKLFDFDWGVIEV